VAASFSRRFLVTVAIVWAVLTLLSMLLWNAPHGGALVYYMFTVIGWPFFFYLEHLDANSFLASFLVEGVYCLTVVALFALVKKLIPKSFC